MIKTVLFDVDGVFLSEERCFDASALTVWELLYSPDYLGLSGESFTVDLQEEDIRRIRRQVFAEDETLNFMKSRGINSNWDMVFLTTAQQLLRLLKRLSVIQPEFVRRMLTQPIGQDELQVIGRTARENGLSFVPEYASFVQDFSRSRADKQALLLYLNDIAQAWLGAEVNVFSRHHSLWKLGQSVYQEWYLGDTYYERSEGSSPRTAGKSGFLENEIALAEPEAIRRFLHDLQKRGLTLGIGTGRPQLETDIPFKAFDFLNFFHPNHIVTATDVIQAETAFPDQAPLGKPQPYTYVKALLGRDQPDEAVLKTPLPFKNRRDVLIVGDSVADYMAARSMGCQFAATLTGLSGKAARQEFEELQADYICEDVLDLARILL